MRALNSVVGTLRIISGGRKTALFTLGKHATHCDLIISTVWRLCTSHIIILVVYDNTHTFKLIDVSFYQTNCPKVNSNGANSLYVLNGKHITLSPISCIFVYVLFSFCDFMQKVLSLKMVIVYCVQIFCIKCCRLANITWL